MSAPASPIAWQLAGVHAGSNGFFLNGIDVFKHKWVQLPGAPPVQALDPQYRRPYTFPVYRIVEGDREIVFAAGEFSNSVFGFYVPATATAVAGARGHATPPPIPSARRPFFLKIAPYIPLIAAVIEVPWLILMVMMAMGTRENAGPPNPYWEREFSFFVIVPVSVGLLAGLVVILCRCTKGWLAQLALLVGCLICAACVFGFGRGMFAPVQISTPIMPG